jgi:hypothetical protein
MIDIVPRSTCTRASTHQQFDAPHPMMPKALAPLMPGQIIPATQYPNPQPNYLRTILDCDSIYPKLVWVIRVTPRGT